MRQALDKASQNITEVAQDQIHLHLSQANQAFLEQAYQKWIQPTKYMQAKQKRHRKEKRHKMNIIILPSPNDKTASERKEETTDLNYKEQVLSQDLNPLLTAPTAMKIHGYR